MERIEQILSYEKKLCVESDDEMFMSRLGEVVRLEDGSVRGDFPYSAPPIVNDAVRGHIAAMLRCGDQSISQAKVLVRGLGLLGGKQDIRTISDSLNRFGPDVFEDVLAGLRSIGGVKACDALDVIRILWKEHSDRVEYTMNDVRANGRYDLTVGPADWLSSSRLVYSRSDGMQTYGSVDKTYDEFAKISLPTAVAYRDLLRKL